MPAGIERLHRDLSCRLRRGEHLLLYGPRGSGKSSLIANLQASLANDGIPCGLAHSTACLNDITRALVDAYPEVDTTAVGRRTARSRLWLAADRQAGVLLLDHVTGVNTVMVGFLRRLRGGIAGVLMAVDVDVARERVRLRNWHVGALAVRMPTTSNARLRALFRSSCAQSQVRRVDHRTEGRIIRAARGRPGWILQCAELAAHPRYWRKGGLFVSLLCSDAEISLRQGDADLLRGALRTEPVVGAAAGYPG